MAKITIKTSDISGAGTDADVMIKVVGNGLEKAFLLDNPGNDFERGSIGVYDVNLQGLTQPQKIQLWFRLSVNLIDVAGATWSVAWVRLEGFSGNSVVQANINLPIHVGVVLTTSLQPVSKSKAEIPQEITENPTRTLKEIPQSEYEKIISEYKEVINT